VIDQSATSREFWKRYLVELKKAILEGKKQMTSNARGWPDLRELIVKALVTKTTWMEN